MRMDVINKASEKEGIDIEENPSYDKNEGNKSNSNSNSNSSNSNNNNKNYVPRDDMISENGSNSNEVVGSDDHYENNNIISDDSDSKNKQMYPSDCYSFLSLYGPIKNPVYFFFGLVICLFQLAFLSLFVLSVLHKNLSSNGEVDNPDDGLLAQFVHSDADPLVRATQILAIISYSLFAESSLQDVVTAVETFPRFDTATNDDKTRRVIFSCLLRFIQGGMAIFSSFVLVVNSSNVIEIILNFTAVNFISNIDDVAFLLARSGKYGPKLEEGATSIENHPLPKCMCRSTKNRRFCYTITFTLVLMLAFIFAIMYAQISDNFWRTTTFRVEFDKETGLEAYTGCYDLDTTQGSSGLLEKKRKIYTNSKQESLSLKDNTDVVQFGYCREDRRWFLYKGNETDPCLAGEDKLAQSVKTQSFDISTSYGDTWTSVSGSPLDLYFIDLNDKTLADQCDSFENGICDDDFNSIDFRYDGGDCCAATCSRPFCGVGNSTEAFGVTLNASGVVGFPDCIDPSMVPITIHLQNFLSSTEPQILFIDCGYDADFGKNLTSKFGDLEGIRRNFNEFITWMNENDPDGYDDYSKKEWSFMFSDPITPLLSLYCDQKSVLSIIVDKAMEGKYETVMVEDGAECTLEIDNEGQDESIWYFNYTIYHDEAMKVKIDEGFSFEEGTKQFTRVRDCFFDTVFSYGYDFQNINYNDLTRKFNWIVEHDVGYQPCSSDFSMERYALSIMNMALVNTTSNVSDDSVLWMNDDMHCMWPSVECKQGLVVGLDLTKVNGISGYTIPNEIGILTNLQKLDLSSTGLIGSIPTEVGLLTELTSLRLRFNGLTGSIPTEIGELTELTSLILDYNHLTGSIPTEVGLLTELTGLWLTDNELTGSIPTEVGLLSELTNLVLTSNELTLTGSIPTEVGLMTELTSLVLNSNKLTGSIPTEIGLLTKLTNVRLDGNIQLKGSIPTEIGELTGLKSLILDYNNLTGSLSTEVGLLTELRILNLEYNELTGSIPTEVGLMTELRTLDLDSNELTGSIPTEIGLLTGLKNLKILGFGSDNNELTGSIPTEIGLLTELTNLELKTSNKLTGTIPTEVRNDYYYEVNNDYSYDLQNETRIEVSDGDYYFYEPVDNYNAVSDLPEIEIETEIEPTQNSTNGEVIVSSTSAPTFLTPVVTPTLAQVEYIDPCSKLGGDCDGCVTQDGCFWCVAESFCFSSNPPKPDGSKRERRLQQLCGGTMTGSKKVCKLATRPKTKEPRPSPTTRYPTISPTTTIPPFPEQDHNAVSDLPEIENDDYYYSFDGTKIEDYYYNDARDNYSAVSNLPEIETEIEI